MQLLVDKWSALKEEDRSNFTRRCGKICAYDRPHELQVAHDTTIHISYSDLPFC